MNPGATRYGLILPNKNEQTKKKETPAAFNIFGDDDSDEEAKKSTGPVGPFGQTSSKTKLKQQSQMDIEKAMMEDPTVYEYDEIYDDMQANKPKVGRDKSEKEKKKDSKPRYITGLLKAAELRKKEGDRRNERKVQKEREAEGEKYADKESFVTSAYKKKMLEMQEEEEREKRKAELEALTDVTKQKDMSGFYRYLYRQTNDGTEDSKEQSSKAIPESNNGVKQEDRKEGVKIKEEPSSPAQRQRSTSSSSKSSEPSNSPVRGDLKTKEASAKQSQFVKKTTSVKRNVRQRRADSSSEDDAGQDDAATSRNDKDTRRSNKKDHRSSSRSRSRSDSDSSFADRREKHKEKSRKRKSELRRSLSRSPGDEERSHSKKQYRRILSQSPPPDRSRVAKDKHRSSRHSSPGEQRKHSKAQVASDPPTSPQSERPTKSTASDQSESLISEETVGPKEAPKINTPVDPSKKVYPHHNSPKDIADARKRYFVRKLERERGSAL